MKVFQQNLTDLRHSAFRLAYAILKNREEAEDIVQDVLLKLWSIKSELQEFENLRVYVLRLIRQRCLEIMKICERNQEENKITVQMDAEVEEALKKDRYIKALHAIDCLPETQRSLLQLRDVEGLNFIEITEIMEIEERDVRINLSQARKRVREALIHEEGHER